MPPVRISDPVGQAFAALRQQVDDHGHRRGGMTEHRRAGAERKRRAVLLQHDAEGAQVDVFDAARPAAQHETRRGRIVGDDAREVELEVLVAGVDDFHRRQHEIGGGQHRADMAPRSLQFALEHEGDFGFDARMDQRARHDLAAVRDGEIIGEEAIGRLVDADLDHFRPRGQAGLDADDLVAPRLLAAADFMLDRIAVVGVNFGIVERNLRYGHGVQFGVFEKFRKLRDGGGRESHEQHLNVKGKDEGVRRSGPSIRRCRRSRRANGHLWRSAPWR